MLYKFKMLSGFIFVIHFAVGITSPGGSKIGLCYDNQGDNLPSPEAAVRMFKEHNIKRMRIYEPDEDILDALRKSDIEVIIGIRNEEIKYIGSSYFSARKWVRNYIKPYCHDIHFRYLVVGNEAIPGKYAGFIFHAILRLNTALSVENLWNIKVTTAVSSSIMNVSHPPSAATFSRDVRALLGPIVHHLSVTKVPLLANVFPYFHYIRNPTHYSLAYALLNISKDVVVNDDYFQYNNMFDELVDALRVSLKTVGVHELTIVVSETGWPSSGNAPFATTKNAQIYYSNVVKHVLSNHGTPRHRGKIETYLYSMFNGVIFPH